MVNTGTILSPGRDWRWWPADDKPWREESIWPFTKDVSLTWQQKEAGYIYDGPVLIGRSFEMHSSDKRFGLWTADRRTRCCKAKSKRKCRHCQDPRQDRYDEFIAAQMRLEVSQKRKLLGLPPLGSYGRNTGHYRWEEENRHIYEEHVLRFPDMKWDLASLK